MEGGRLSGAGGLRVAINQEWSGRPGLLHVGVKLHWSLRARTMLNAALTLFFPFLMAYAAASDMLSMTISNKVSLALIAGFFLFGTAIQMNFSEMAWHVAVFAIVLTAGFALFAAGTIGGGDAKLAAAAALWLGWGSLLPYLLISALIGAMLTLVILRLRSMPIPQRLTSVVWIARLHRADEGIPYGIALGAGGILVYPQSAWMQHVFANATAIFG
jgi:prepilin peptidase CpaA